jgi:hypothetical protein
MNRPKLAKLVPKDKTLEIKNLLLKYKDVLNKYYDYNYIYDNYETKNMLTDVNYLSFDIAKGSYKSLNLFSPNLSDKYIITKIKPEYMNDIKNHLLLIEKYYETIDENKYEFCIPKIYFSEEYYIMEYVIFDTTHSKYGKFYKLDFLHCKAYGQFLNFCINICNVIPLDHESYIQKTDNVLYFLDFGNFQVLKNKEIYHTELIKKLHEYCDENMIQTRIKTYGLEKSYFDNCDNGIKCIIEYLHHF